MTSLAEALLLTLAKRPLKTTPESGDAARELCAAGLAELRETKGGTSILLTDAGVARKDEVKKAQAAAKKKAAAPAKKPAAAKRARAATTTDLEELEARLAQRMDALEDRLAARIEALLGARVPSPVGDAAPGEERPHEETPRDERPREEKPHELKPREMMPSPSSADVADRVVRATDSLAVKHGRLVPIAALRRELEDVPRPTLDRVLFDLERRRQIYLKIANDPLAVPHPEEGIRIVDRGLVYYAALP